MKTIHPEHMVLMSAAVHARDKLSGAKPADRMNEATTWSYPEATDAM